MTSELSQQISIRMKEATKACFVRWGEKRRFCMKYGIHYGNFHRALTDYKTNRIDPAWIAALVMEYDISADWILTGRGGMCMQKKSDTHVIPNYNN